MMEQEIDGVTYVLVEKDIWEKIWNILDRIDEMDHRWD